MNLTLNITDEAITQLKDITGEEDDKDAVFAAIRFTLDNY